MSKYDNNYSEEYSLDLKKALVEGENVIWEGKPKKSAFIINKIFMMMPIAIIWLAFDGFFILNLVKAPIGGDFPKLFLIPFFALHLMPVWIWLSNVLTANRRWKNTVYAVTDKRIIMQSGFIGMDYQSIYFKDIKDVVLRIGVIDRLLGVGDIYFSVSQVSNGKARAAFLDIPNPHEVYPKIQKIVLDIQTDIEYPNDLRPKENHGYKTEYKG